MASPNRYSDLPEHYVPGGQSSAYGYPPPVPPKPTYLQQPMLTMEMRGSRPVQFQRATECATCERKVNLWTCLQCCDAFCDICWPKYGPHRPGKVGIDGRPHERVDADVIDRLSKIFTDPSQEEQKLRHNNDINTTWFGVFKEDDKAFLDYTNRIVDILQESQMGGYMEDFPERFPLLVSFVGQTGAGKSTIIKMLINRQQAMHGNMTDYPAPVPGLVADTVPTTGNVHLYADPGTYYAQKPILYADCEGMTGGESTPRGLSNREKLDKKPARAKLRKPLDWAKGPKMQSREYAVSTLFPRILYPFSDVVVFTLREARTFQTEVLRQLISWARISFDKSLNQPTLPHVVIVLNATESNVDDTQLDIDTATQALLGDYKNSINQVPELQEIVIRLQRLGKPIKSTKELLEYYYSSVSVVRIPRKGRYMQIDEQVGKLYGLIYNNCQTSSQDKEKNRMLLNAERLPQYINAAYDHFSRRLDEPFDFAKEARRHTPLPKGFGAHVLNLILSLYNTHDRGDENARILLRKLCRPLASCVMLAATRDNIQGAYSDLLLNTYYNPLRVAFVDFCEKWLRCSYTRDGYQCCNVKTSHKKGHQAVTGEFLGRGPYQSTFDDEFFAEWVNEIDRHIQNENEYLNSQHDRTKKTLPARHKDIMAMFYGRTGPASRIKSHLTCLCCVRKIPETVLPCGHILCKACIQSFGRSLRQGIFDLDCCPLHPRDTLWASPMKIRYKPADAGVRILCLDGGGVRGIIELVILRAIERELGDKIRIQNFFDLIVGTSTGGIIALGLGVKGWSVDHCILRFNDLCHDAFTSRGPLSLKKLTIFRHKSYYRTKPLEQALQSAFSPHLFLYGGRPMPPSSVEIRVAVTSTHATEKKAAVLSNYNTEGDRDGLPYKFVRPQDPTRELRIWEAARATAAAPPYFKPFFHPETNNIYTDGAIHHNCPAVIADHERRLLWQDVSDWPPDIMLSLGTGLSSSRTTDQPRGAFSTHPSDISESESSYRRQKNANGLKLMWWAANDIVENQLDCEESWRKHCARSTPPGQQHGIEEKRRNLRINVELPGDRPRLDDVKELDSMQRYVEDFILDNPKILADVHEAAHRLVASSFYFEKLKNGSTLDRNTGVYKCKGYIQCRFDQDSQDAKGIGHILRNCVRGTRFTPHFFLEENYGSPDQRNHEVPLALETISEMCNSGEFRLPTELEIEATYESSITRLSLCLQEDFYVCRDENGIGQAAIGPWLSISGFPRKLWTRSGQTLPTRQSDEVADIDKEDVCELPGAEVRPQSVPPAGSVTQSPSVTAKLFRKPIFGTKSAPGGLNTLRRITTSSSDLRRGESSDKAPKESPRPSSSLRSAMSSDDASFVSTAGSYEAVRETVRETDQEQHFDDVTEHCKHDWGGSQFQVQETLPEGQESSAYPTHQWR